MFTTSGIAGFVRCLNSSIIPHLNTVKDLVDNSYEFWRNSPKYNARLATSSFEQNRPVGCLAVNIFIASSSDIPLVPATRPRKL